MSDLTDKIKDCLNKGQLKGKYNYANFNKLITKLITRINHTSFVKDRGVLKGTTDIKYLTEEELVCRKKYELEIIELLEEGLNYREVKEFLISKNRTSEK